MEAFMKEWSQGIGNGDDVVGATHGITLAKDWDEKYLPRFKQINQIE